MLRLHLIRHGETDYNKQGIVQGGGVDSDLNEQGLAQGKAFFETYKETKFEAIYSSRLKRTYQTIQYFEQLGYEIRQHAGVNEFSWGDLEGKPSSEETRRWFMEVTDAWRKGWLNVGMPNGETPLTAWQRAKPFFDELFDTHQSGDILICTHGRTLRVILAQLLGVGLHNMHLFHHDNTGLNILECYPDGRKELLVQNDLKHLKRFGLASTRVNYGK